MKKILSLCAVFMTALSTLAYDFQADGFFFNILSANTVEVTSKNSRYPYNPTDLHVGDVVVPSSVTYNGQTYTVVSIGAWAFHYCIKATSFEIPATVTSIQRRAFQECRFTSFTFPASVTKVCQGAFWLCQQLESIELPNTITEIEADVFCGCHRINRPMYNDHFFVYLPTSYQGAYQIPQDIPEIAAAAFHDCKGLTNVTIPSSVTRIGSQAFRGCTAMTAIRIPGTVTEIGRLAFEECSNLQAIEVAEDNAVFASINGVLYNRDLTKLLAYPAGHPETECVIPDHVTEIGECGFCDCARLTSVSIPSSVTKVGASAFACCPSLTSVEFPNSVTEIGGGMFENCYSLTSVKLPSGLTSIGQLVFLHCSGLTSVTISGTVTEIGKWAFYGCTSLPSVVLPKSVKSMADWVFLSCTAMTELISLNSTPPAVETNTFGDIPLSTCLLKVPAEALEAYKSAEVWNTFQNIVALTDEEMHELSITAPQADSPALSVPFTLSGTPALPGQKGILLHSGKKWLVR